jgi:hypothetical protein
LIEGQFRDLERVGLVTRDEPGAEEQSHWSAVGEGVVFEIPDEIERQTVAQQLTTVMLLPYVDLPHGWVADAEPRLKPASTPADRLLNARFTVTPDELRRFQEGLERLLEVVAAELEG